MESPFRYLITIGAIALVSNSFGQEALLRKAERLYARYSFAEAITWYERAFEQGAQNLVAARHLADSYHRVRDLKSSEKWYALLAGSPDALPSDLMGYADALRSNAKYTQADSVMAIYARMDPEDSRVGQFSSTADMSSQFLVDPLLEGEVLPLPWNSPETDMCPAMLNGKIVFASSRTPQSSIQRTHAWDGQPLLNLYMRTDSGVALFKGDVNTRYHESNATFSTDGTEMYFTRNNYLGGKSKAGSDGVNNLMIYRSALVNGSWTAETAFEHNDPSFSTGHPSLSRDGRTLYFASNRPGGSGGVDIWKCTREGPGPWGDPINLGAHVNTEGDEMFPCIQGDRALFFASDGRAGLGGLDIFLSYMLGSGPQEPRNVGAPVNSSSDDMSFVLDKDSLHGYFSSDRVNGRGGTDIYELVLEEPFTRKIRIGGRMLSEEDAQPLANIPVRLLRPNRSLLAQQLTGVDGSFEFTVQPQAMTISAGIPGGSDLELPMDEHLLLMDQADIKLGNMALSSIVDVPLEVRILDQKTGLPARGAKVVLVDVNNGGRVIAEGIADQDGVVLGNLADVAVGKDLELQLMVCAAGQPGRSVQLPFHVKDGTDRLIEERYDMGDAILAVVRAKQSAVFHFLENDEQDEANVWAGRVLDRKDHGPLASVPISLLDIGRNELDRTLTDASGSYRLGSNNVPHSILVSMPGGPSYEIADISPFGDEAVPDAEIDGTLAVPVNASLKDAMTNGSLPGVRVTVKDRRDGRLLFSGTTDQNGLSRGTIPEQRFGTEQDMRVSMEKDGYVPKDVDVDMQVTSFQEHALGGSEGFFLIPTLAGADLARAMDLRPIHYHYNDASIPADALDELDLVAHVMSMEPNLRIELRSHTDSRGSASFNQFLSTRRAQMAKIHLIEKGIHPDRIIATGMGERQPLNRCSGDVECSEQEHEANRRTEFVVVSCKDCGTALAPKR